MKLEQVDQEAAFPTDLNGVSIDGTGQVGTYFYTAPEIEQGWPKIDEKVSLMAVLFGFTSQLPACLVRRLSKTHLVFRLTCIA